MRRLLPLLLALPVFLAGCGGGGSPTGVKPTLVPHTKPNLAAFLRLPVATPSACPGSDATTVGRSSPWVGRVDVSVFVSPKATSAQLRQLGHRLRGDRLVHTVYFETQRQAYEEFQRLYTCWAAVPRGQTPASYRLILVRSVTLAQRNALVARLIRLPRVDSVSCDPSVPCVSTVRSARPTGSGGP